ncbi:uncharacterized protein LOC135112626 [Scylla paramamosain]|uniref:uncharacterized protein LOC135112626 n=1 Tax=Scylla paramamosain TaxID=85552 RepID=UPI0030839DFD
MVPDLLVDIAEVPCVTWVGTVRSYVVRWRWSSVGLVVVARKPCHWLCSSGQNSLLIREKTPCRGLGAYKGDKVQRSQEAAVHVVRGCLACSHLPALTQDSLMCSLPRSELHRPCCLAARHHSLPLLTVSSRKNEKAVCVVAFLAESECKPLSRRCASLSSLPGAAALGASPGDKGQNEAELLVIGEEEGGPAITATTSTTSAVDNP